LDYEQLKHKNSTDTQEVNRAYPPENYWIPKGQWNSIVNLLTRNLPLLPEILEIVDALAVEETMRLYYQATKKSLEDLGREQSSHQREMASQVGKMNEQNSRWVRDLEALLKNQVEQNQRNLWKKMIWILTDQSIFLTLMMILLTLILR